ncbi:hypothetical protein [uncultured Anaerococcus sp.]|uniref:hypothetical protein n=1 Tax=uncultured Anaerococcus sp. TaxID=293428 RepID=UPI0025E192D3|nr:hypothetical protein [uncultured Anaerococcus sp.]
MSRREKLLSLRKEIEATTRATRKLVMVSDINEEDYKDLIDLYPKWEVGIEIKPTDPPYSYEGSLYRVVQGHKTQGDWTPDKVASLFTKVEPKKDKEGAEIVPNFKKPLGGHDAYKKGDKVVFEGKVYESLIDNNVYSPSEYAQGWKEVEV